MNNANDKITLDGEYNTGIGNEGQDQRFEFRQGFIDAEHPSDGQYYKGKKEAINPYDRNSVITKVDGVQAYSQQASLYKGISDHGEFWPQPGLDTRIGKMPRGKYHPEPKRPQVERNKKDFLPQGPYDKEGRTPLVSPLTSAVQDSTTADEAIHTTYRDLKSKLHTGMGSRTNKYVLELDIPVNGNTPTWTNDNLPTAGATPNVETLNILCQSTSFPQRQMHTASLWRFGRKYNLRGETNFGDTWQLEFVDDSMLTVRRAMDRWFIDIDDTKLQDEGLQGLYRKPQAKLQAKNLINREENAKLDWANASKAYNSGFNKEYNNSIPGYQTDIRVFQLDQVGNKTTGYLMQNAFISEISQIEYGDAKENELTKFTITITFSEFIPLSPDHNTLYQKMLN